MFGHFENAEITSDFSTKYTMTLGLKVTKKATKKIRVILELLFAPQEGSKLKNSFLKGFLLL